MDVNKQINLGDFFTEQTRGFFQSETRMLLGIMDQDCRLSQWNQSFSEFLPALDTEPCLYSHLVASSHHNLKTIISSSKNVIDCQKIILNFSSDEISLPDSYAAFIMPIKKDLYLLFAEPLPHLDKKAAEDYLKITNQFSAITRELQKTRHDLLLKQQEYEQAMKELERVSVHDGLTGIFNRRKVMLELDREIERALRYKTSLALLMIDIDHFKKVNDNFGHQVGDIVLKTVSGVMASALRKVDILGRYGGEEFIIFLPQTDLPSAKILAERLRSHIEDMLIETESVKQLSITASIGIAIFDPEKDDADLFISRADKALYWAKDTGRNRVVAL